MSRPRLVVFDMIGTTVRPSDSIRAAFASALQTAGIELSDSDISAVRGKSKRAAIAELLGTHGNVDEVYRVFQRQLLHAYRDDAVHAIDGARRTFEWCHERGIRTALTTGFGRELATLLIEKLAWRNAVDTIVCSDDVEHGRPAPDLILESMKRSGVVDPACVASIGDTLSDLQAGASAGTAWNIGVLTGAHTRKQLAGAPHTVLLDSVADLPDLLAG